MRGITIDLLTHHQSETYRLLDEVQLFVSLDGILEVQHNGRHTSCYDQLLIVNRLSKSVSQCISSQNISLLHIAAAILTKMHSHLMNASSHY